MASWYLSNHIAGALASSHAGTPAHLATRIRSNHSLSSTDGGS
ncbi:MAG: hypothetical protein AAGU15_09030 [Anaerolineaceae bacterium]